MKAFATIGLGSLGSISFQHAIHALPADRPYGVPVDCWIRLDEKLGLVISAPTAAGHGVNGYWMVKQAGTWHRLNVEQPPTATARHPARSAESPNAATAVEGSALHSQTPATSEESNATGAKTGL
jgi:hypothetical protein